MPKRQRSELPAATGPPSTFLTPAQFYAILCRDEARRQRASSPIDLPLNKTQQRLLTRAKRIIGKIQCARFDPDRLKRNLADAKVALADAEVYFLCVHMPHHEFELYDVVQHLYERFPEPGDRGSILRCVAEAYKPNVQCPCGRCKQLAAPPEAGA